VSVHGSSYPTLLALNSTEASWVLTLRHGERIVVPATLRNLSTYTFLEREDWFEPEAEFVRRLARPGLRSIDIGANIGFYTILLARGAGPSGFVWAVEPNRELTRRLRQSLIENQLTNATVLDVAIGDRRGPAWLIREGSPEFHRVSFAAAGAAATDAITIETLDALANQHGIRDVDFVKLDAEGAEAAILRAGAAFFARESPLVMTEIKHGHTVQSELLGLLKELGYRLMRYAPALRCLVPLAGDETDLSSLNVFAAKADRLHLLLAADLAVVNGDGVHQEPAMFADFFRHTEFGHRWITEINSLQDWTHGSQASEYRRALDCYATSRIGTSASVRYAALRDSFRRLREVCARRPTVPALISHARVALDLGLTDHALPPLDWIVKALRRGEQLDMPEPCLPLSERYETTAMGIDMIALITAMVLETYGACKYATGLNQPESYDLVENIVRLGVNAPEFERRRQLYRMFVETQAGPVFSTALTDGPAPTVNLDFWRGALPLA